MVSQEESGADIYLDGTTLHVHPPGEIIGKERLYDFSVNIEKADLSCGVLKKVDSGTGKLGYGFTDSVH